MRGKLNTKGFTLIELLAVIVILAILMTLAITGMSGVIRNAKKDTFVTTAQQYANSLRTKMISGEYDAPGIGQCTVITTNRVELESGSHKSSFDRPFDDALSYFVIYNNGTNGEDSYKYYIQMFDTQANGFVLVEESTLSKANIKEKSKTGNTALPGTTGTSLTHPDGTCTVTQIYKK